MKIKFLNRLFGRRKAKPLTEPLDPKSLGPLRAIFGAILEEDSRLAFQRAEDSIRGSKVYDLYFMGDRIMLFVLKEGEQGARLGVQELTMNTSTIVKLEERDGMYWPIDSSFAGVTMLINNIIEHHQYQAFKLFKGPKPWYERK